MPSSLAAAVYESIVAAIYLDGGFDVVKEYVLRTMSPKIDVHRGQRATSRITRRSFSSTPRGCWAQRRSTNCSMKRAPTTASVLRCASPSTGGDSPQRWGPEQENGRAEGGAAGAGRTGGVRCRRKWMRRFMRLWRGKRSEAGKRERTASPCEREMTAGAFASGGVRKRGLRPRPLISILGEEVAFTRQKPEDNRGWFTVETQRPQRRPEVQGRQSPCCRSYS